MTIDPFAAPSRLTVDLNYYFGVIADTLEWSSPGWIALEARLRAKGRAPDEMTLDEVMKAISSTRCTDNAKPGTQVRRLIGVHDPSRHDVFRAIRRLLRIYDLRIVELLELIDVLERCPGNLEDMSIKNLLALISIVDTNDAPLAHPPPMGSCSPPQPH